MHKTREAIDEQQIALTEISNELKAKVFAQYLGQTFKSNGRKYKMTVTETTNTHEKSLFFATDNVCELILKPLSTITDEDAIEASSIIGGASHLSKESQIAQLKELFSLPSFFVNQTNISGYKWLQCIQYLQSKGYDLPHFLLGGKTLQEAGLAIYEN
ncbi:MAG TPA: hypothetical protein VN026_00175 [Bacteroidia bacterium]|jgi:hypothetical protein|nr:hypothetical protein [Bacteroidia bacterium]